MPYFYNASPNCRRTSYFKFNKYFNTRATPIEGHSLVFLTIMLLIFSSMITNSLLLA